MGIVFPPAQGAGIDVFADGLHGPAHLGLRHGGGALQLQRIFLCQRIFLRVRGIQAIFMIPQSIIHRILLHQVLQQLQCHRKCLFTASDDHVSCYQYSIRVMSVDGIQKYLIVLAKLHAVQVCKHCKPWSFFLLYFFHMDRIMYSSEFLHISPIFQIRNSGRYRHRSSDTGRPLPVL